MDQTNLEEERIQKLLENYLKFSTATGNSTSHLDEDSLNSFVEGRLNRAESSAAIDHLSHCSFCLHTTAELAKLEADLTAEKIPARVESQKPEKISEVLNDLFSKIFGTSDNAVFAHQEDEEKPKKED